MDAGSRAAEQAGFYIRRSDEEPAQDARPKGMR